MFEKKGRKFKFIFFFFIFFLIFLKQAVAYSFENYKLKLQYLISSISSMQNIIYILCYILILGVLFYFIWKAVSISPFSESVSFILSVGLVLILAFMEVVGKISTVFFNIFEYFIDKGLIYTILFLVSLLIILFVAKYIFGWIIYYTKGSKEKRKKEKEKLERAEVTVAVSMSERMLGIAKTKIPWRWIIIILLVIAFFIIWMSLGKRIL